MELSLSPCGMSSAQISTYASVGSLDIELLVDPPLMHSLMSESITVCSISSIPSGDLPKFAVCKLPTWGMIGLGDRLKMFSSPEGPQSNDRKKNSNGTVSISIPTSPRLRMMLKECLSISKWVESSTAWQPPGHVPWESVYHDTATPWIPEGSMFSPEYFSSALLHSRHSHRGIQSRPKASIPSASIPPISVAIGIQSTPFTNQDSIDAELLSMMQELKTIRTFFQSSESLNGISPATFSVPSLVISNSDFAFPMSLESSSSITPARSNSLASRRGKKAPPSLLLRKGRSTTDLSYPGIPTAFLGSPSHYTPKFEETNKEEKPSLEFEDMINNLRLQCSTMALQTPPSDPSLNSRSSPEPEGPTEAECDEWSFATELMKEHKRPVQQIPRPKAQRTHRRANSHDTLVAKEKSQGAVVPKSTNLSKKSEKQATVPQTLHIRNTNAKQVALPKTTSLNKATVKPKGTFSKTRSVDDLSSDPSCRMVISNKTCPPEPLRSAIVKLDSSRLLKSSKSVRFFLPRQDLLKEVATPVLQEEVVSKEEQSSVSNEPSASIATSTSLTSQTGPKGLICQSPGPVLSRKTSKIARALVTAPLSRVRERDCATPTITPPPKSSVNSSAYEGPQVNLTKSSSRMSVHSLGRHSLSRIMKGPLFASKDKRATLSSLPFIPINDENAARREGSAVPPIFKKSRMPVPLRNIFDRFK